MPEREADIAADLREEHSRELLEQRVAGLERELAQLRGREAGWRQERRRLLAALEDAEREVAQLPALRRELETARDAAYWLAVMRESWTWRLGAPMRAAARLAGRRRRGRHGS